MIELGRPGKYDELYWMVYYCTDMVCLVDKSATWKESKRKGKKERKEERKGVLVSHKARYNILRLICIELRYHQTSFW